MVQLPYLQPFDDGTSACRACRRTSRFIKRNLSPLSFIDVPRALYTEALLGVYELNRSILLRIYSSGGMSGRRHVMPPSDSPWGSPIRSGSSTRWVRQIVGEVVARVDGQEGGRGLCRGLGGEERHPETEPEKFRDMAEAELVSLHEGNFARYQIRPSEFEAWRQVWKEACKSMSDTRLQDLVTFDPPAGRLGKRLTARERSPVAAAHAMARRAVYFFPRTGENRSATGRATIEEVWTGIFRFILEVASGRKPTWADPWGLHNALVLFNPGPHHLARSNQSEAFCSALSTCVSARGLLCVDAEVFDVLEHHRRNLGSVGSFT